MSELEKLCEILEAMASNVTQWASRLDQESMKIHSRTQQLYTALRQSNRPEGTKAISSLDNAQHLVRDASRMMQQVSVGARAWIAVTIAAGARGVGTGSEEPTGESGGNVPSIKDVASWLPNINPHYYGSPYSPYSTNCGKCAASVFKRLEGNSNAAAGIGTLSVEEMNAVTGKTQTPMTPGKISDYLISQGAGAHAVVGIDRAKGNGHWFNAYYDGQKVYAIDGQDGTVSDWPPDYGDVISWDVSV